jgi:hypothetical protein
MMPHEAKLIIQVARGSRVELQLAADPPASLASDDVVVEVGEADAQGNLEPPAAGDVVLAVPAPASLSREPEVLRRVLDGAGPGSAPLVVVIEAAEELTDADLRLVLDAAAHASRPVILRLIRDA